MADSQTYSLSGTDGQRLIYGLSLASVAIFINLYLTQGMLPMLAERFDVSAGHSTLVVSVTSFSLALSLLGYALLSDRIGRRRPLIASLWLLALSNLLLFWVPDFDALLWLRLGQGMLLASVPAIAMAYLKDRLPPVMLMTAAALYIAANSFGGIAGRLLGGVMAQYLDWNQAVLLLTVLTLLLVASAQWLLGIDRGADKRHVRQGQGALGGFVLHLGNPYLRGLYLLGGLAFMVMVNQFSFIQLHLMAEPFGWNRFQATLIFLCYLSGTLSSGQSARLMNKLGTVPLLILSIGLMALGSVLTLANTELAICLGFLCSACGFFLIHACCNSLVALGAEQHRAKATALYLCSYYLGAALGGPFLMPFWQTWHWQGVVAGSLLLIAANALALWRWQHLAKSRQLDTPVSLRRCRN
ncbi:MFS transporter [Shewanella sedimentimangrovi]|uniref:MFS transporter n=1 Tax=Shewanella sedimentimangrovi TaxID=2814293 RepID=A0ABX7QYW6_9GAMM|nr:MFS transporter [Shewanella sedimentimangrovi]QSX35998.1 MFS transporter [Shewanella sedimentimangrovi]